MPCVTMNSMYGSCTLNICQLQRFAPYAHSHRCLKKSENRRPSHGDGRVTGEGVRPVQRCHRHLQILPAVHQFRAAVQLSVRSWQQPRSDHKTQRVMRELRDPHLPDGNALARRIFDEQRKRSTWSWLCTLKISFSQCLRPRKTAATTVTQSRDQQKNLNPIDNENECVPRHSMG